MFKLLSYFAAAVVVFCFGTLFGLFGACNNNNEEAPINNCQSVIDDIRQTNGAGTYYIEVKKVTFSGTVVVYNDTASVQ
jgi:hypothetical protein